MLPPARRPGDPHHRHVTRSSAKHPLTCSRRYDLTPREVQDRFWLSCCFRGSGCLPCPTGTPPNPRLPGQPAALAGHLDRGITRGDHARAIKGRCGTPLRFVSSLGLRPSRTPDAAGRAWAMAWPSGHELMARRMTSLMSSSGSSSFSRNWMLALPVLNCGCRRRNASM